MENYPWDGDVLKSDFDIFHRILWENVSTETKGSNVFNKKNYKRKKKVRKREGCRLSLRDIAVTK